MTATKTAGMGDHVYVGGYALSQDVQQVGKIGGGPSPLVMTDITQSAFARAGGLRAGQIDLSCYLDVQSNQAHAVLSPLPRTSTIVSYFHVPGTIGSAAASLNALQIGYDPARAADGMLTIGVNAMDTKYGLEWGESLTPGDRTDTSATNGASFDGGAATTFGAQAYLHLTGFTGTNVTVTIQDSADNASFASLMAFTAATGRTFERIAVTGTVRRYVRAVTSGTFSSATFVVNFVRNQTAVTF